MKSKSITNINEQKLEYYSRNISGGMNGAFHSVKIVACDNCALMTFSNKDNHNQEPSIESYKVDIKILADIKEVFDKYQMQKWHHKKFINLFINDKASISYNFGFSENEISFSSQTYPEEYAEKLKEIEEIITTYKK